MLIVITDRDGESIYADVQRVSYEAEARRVVFVLREPPAPSSPNALIVSKGRVEVIDNGAFIRQWDLPAEPTDA